jgi:hypothetical protein
METVASNTFFTCNFSEYWSNQSRNDVDVLSEEDSIARKSVDLSSVTTFFVKKAEPEVSLVS